MKKLIVAILSILVLSTSAFSGALLTYPKFQAWTDAGKMLTSGKLYTYYPGTSTAKWAYTDKTLATQAANPIILNARGEATVYLKGAYKLVLKTSSGTTIWTQDNVVGIGGSGEADSDDYGCDMHTMLDTIGSDNITVRVSCSVNVDDNYTSPSNISYRVIRGGNFALATGKRLTINGGFESGNFQTFYGGGNVTFGGLAKGPVNPLWWVNMGTGTEADSWESTLDSAAGFKKALDSGAKRVHAPAGFYDASAIPDLTHGQILTGDGGNATVFTSSNTTTGIDVGDSNKVENVKYAGLRDINVQCTGTGAKCVRLSAVANIDIQNVQIDVLGDNQTGLYLDAACAVPTDPVLGGCNAQGYHSGVYYSKFSNIIIAGPSSTSTNTALVLRGASGYAGNAGGNVFDGIKLDYVKYGMLVDTALSNTFIGVLCEQLTDSTDSRCIKWGSSSSDNTVVGIYTEMPTSSWSGTIFESSSGVHSIRNSITQWKAGKGSSPSPKYPNRVLITGTNTVSKGPTIYAQGPYSDEDEESTEIIGSDTYPINITVPGELGPRLRIGTNGLSAQNSGNKTESTKTATSVTRSSTTATVTKTSHGAKAGNYVTVTGADQTEYNVTNAYVQSNAGDEFTYIVSGSPATPATGTILFTITSTPDIPVYVAPGGVCNLRQAIYPSTTAIDVSAGHDIYIQDSNGSLWGASEGNVTIEDMYGHDLYSSPIIRFEATPSDTDMCITFDGNHTETTQTQISRYSAAAADDAIATVTIPATYDVKVCFKAAGTHYWHMTSRGASTYRTWHFTTPIYGPVP